MISDLCTISVVRQKHANMIFMIKNIEGLVHDCSNSSALAMELFQSCSKPSKWSTRARIKNPFQVNQLSLCRNVRWIINVVMVILLERLHLSCDISRTIGTLWSGGHRNLKWIHCQSNFGIWAENVWTDNSNCAACIRPSHFELIWCHI